jgi:hypothetical protein
MALISKDKPLGLLFRLVFLLMLWEWFCVLKTIYSYGIFRSMHGFSPTYLMWIFGNSCFIYLYVRNELIAWHVEFTAIVATMILALVKFLIQRDVDVQVIVGVIVLYGGTALYMILRYQAYSDYVKDLSNPM